MDAEPERADRFAISSVPARAFVQHGRLVDRQEGRIDPRLLVSKLDPLAGPPPATP
ncbi:MAG: hypothetical protein U0871_19305 [Gemmataceae bacterium]